jgi:hydrogenase maturation protease
MTKNRDKILILGIGNYLMGDEGVGVHAIKAMEKMKFPDGVKVVDGGTGGFHLLSFFEEFPVIILIDATMDKKPQGTIRLIEPKFASDYPVNLSAHDIGLRDLIESSFLIDKKPKTYLFTISIEEMQYMSVTLSQPVANAIGEVIDKVSDLVKSLVSTIDQKILVE